MAQLDTMTQQNAAMFQQTDATSQALIKASDDLTKDMQKFLAHQEPVTHSADASPNRPTVSTPSTGPAAKAPDPAPAPKRTATAAPVAKSGAAALKSEDALVIGPGDLSDWDAF